jgi:hypothetical protein
VTPEAVIARRTKDPTSAPQPADRTWVTAERLSAAEDGQLGALLEGDDEARTAQAETST